MSQLQQTATDQVAKILRRDVAIAAARVQLAHDAAECEFMALEEGSLEVAREHNQRIREALVVALAVLSGH